MPRLPSSAGGLVNVLGSAETHGIAPGGMGLWPQSTVTERRKVIARRMFAAVASSSGTGGGPGSSSGTIESGTSRPGSSAAQRSHSK
jgi:hypothetical protein